MKKVSERIRVQLYKLMLRLPGVNFYSRVWYSRLGVKGSNYRMSSDVKVVGDFALLELGSQTEINVGCFILAKERIVIGENTTLAYEAAVLTSANPNGPHNKLAKIYPKIKAPVIIGHDCWVGARAIILPGVKIGNYCVVAAGSVVTKDIADYTVVAGVPAKPVKVLDPRAFNSYERYSNYSWHSSWECRSPR